ncbi:hypothetical protein [Micromonospora fulviviridis]|uniref:Uncharacterized protein n=1 Tax=Micromonospora fulviviridis TaxID=47860 RepID=A0ABV2VRW3_9ACTN
MDGSPRAHLRRLARLATAAALAVAGLGLVAPPAHAEAGPKVAVLARNLYLGGDLTPSIAAPTLPAFLAANAALLSHVDLEPAQIGQTRCPRYEAGTDIHDHEGVYAS